MCFNPNLKLFQAPDPLAPPTCTGRMGGRPEPQGPGPHGPGLPPCQTAGLPPPHADPRWPAGSPLSGPGGENKFCLQQIFIFDLRNLVL